jgi:hypothetical protein
MEMLINDYNNFQTIQVDFNRIFPYLRLEFISKSGEVGSAQVRINSAQKPLSNYRIDSDNIITITPEDTVGDLEKKFLQIYGLNVLVLRKSGKAWLETSLTESWTLAEQNKQGEQLSNS